MSTPEICGAGFDALLRRVADLEVAVKRRHDDAVNADARLSEHDELLARQDKLLRRLIDGDQPVADARQDKAMRKRALIAALAEATGLGYKERRRTAWPTSSPAIALRRLGTKPRRRSCGCCSESRHASARYGAT